MPKAKFYSLEDYLCRNGGKDALKPGALKEAIALFEEVLSKYTTADGEYRTASEAIPHMTLSKKMKDFVDGSSETIGAITRNKPGILAQIVLHITHRENGKLPNFEYIDLLLQVTEATLRIVKGYGECQKDLPQSITDARTTYCLPRIESISNQRQSYAGDMFADLRPEPYAVSIADVAEIGSALGVNVPSIFLNSPQRRAKAGYPKTYQGDLFEKPRAP